jgi:hypothetical protein
MAKRVPATVSFEPAHFASGSERAMRSGFAPAVPQHAGEAAMHRHYTADVLRPSLCEAA